jgi:hypothetical protein
MRVLLHLLLVLAIAASVTACTSDDGTRASSIVCSTAYRVSPSEQLTEVDTMTFQDEDATLSMPYIYLELHGAYTAGRADGERALRLWVTPTGEDRELMVQLFQFAEDDGPTDQFVGGHGFTGLTYAFDPVSGAELQYWCETG